MSVFPISWLQPSLMKYKSARCCGLRGFREQVVGTPMGIVLGSGSAGLQLSDGIVVVTWRFVLGEFRLSI